MQAGNFVSTTGRGALGVLLVVALHGWKGYSGFRTVDTKNRRKRVGWRGWGMGSPQAGFLSTGTKRELAPASFRMGCQSAQKCCLASEEKGEGGREGGREGGMEGGSVPPPPPFHMKSRDIHHTTWGPKILVLLYCHVLHWRVCNNTPSCWPWSIHSQTMMYSSWIYLHTGGIHLPRFCSIKWGDQTEKPIVHTCVLNTTDFIFPLKST